MSFTTPTSGSIEVSGQPLAELDPTAWREQVAWVSQQPTLFAGTVAQNISLGRPGATAEEIRAAARRAGAESFIEDLPDGFGTALGERGLRLSGGQRQRLAIARAALLDRPFVLLDEFTANLDRDTEAEIVRAMRSLLEGRTAVIVAHRPETIAAASRVVTLDGGRLVEGVR